MTGDKGMTIRQIADLCGVSERTVRDWAWKAAAKTAADSAAGTAAEDTPIGKKMLEAGHGKPATLWIDEVLESVRAGGKNTLADLLAENAAREAPAVVPDTRLDRLESLVERMLAGIPAMIAQTVQALSQNAAPAPRKLMQGQLALPPASEGAYFAITGYARRLGTNIGAADAVKLGREAVRVSNAKNYAVHKVEDERYGTVNSYHIDVLKEVYTI